MESTRTMDAIDDDSDRYSYECDRCHGVFDSRRDEPEIHGPSRSSPDGLARYYCQACRRERDEAYAALEAEASARCNFCDGPMPCDCEPPSEEEMWRAWEADGEARNRVDLSADRD